MTTSTWAGHATVAADAPRAHGTGRTALVFSGQGNQWLGMGQDLIAHEPSARAVLEEADAVLRAATGWSLLGELAASRAESRLEDPAVLQPTLVALQIALARLLAERGVVADAFVGHSLGEIAAAAAAGALDLAGALRLARLRGELMRRAVGTGRTALLGVDAEVAAALIERHGGAADIAAWNAPGSTLVAGDATTVRAVVDELAAQEVFSRLLPGEIAFHSRYLEPLRAEFAEAARGIEPRATIGALVSTVTGDVVDGPALGHEYWADNLRRPVRFVQAVDTLVGLGCRTFVEVGAHPTLSPSLTECCAARGVEPLVLPTLRRGEGEQENVLRTVWELRRAGAAGPARARGARKVRFLAAAGKDAPRIALRGRVAQFAAGAAATAMAALDTAAREATHPAAETYADPTTDTCADPATETCADPATGTCADPATETYADPATETYADPATDTCADTTRHGVSVDWDTTEDLVPEEASVVAGPVAPGAATVAAYGRTPGSAWTRLLTARREVLVPTPETEPHTLAALTARCAAPRTVADTAAETAWHAERDVLVRLRPGIAPGLRSLLDVALRITAAVLGAHAPRALRGIELYATEDRPYWVHVARTEDGGAGITVMAEDGRPLLRVARSAWRDRAATVTGPADTEAVPVQESADLDALLAADAVTREALLTERVRQAAATALRTTADRIPAQRPLNKLGMDSVMGLEMRRSLAADFGVEIGLVRILRGATAADLAADLAAELGERLAPEQTPGAAHDQREPGHGPGLPDLDDPADIERLLADLDALSPEEVDSLLGRLAGDAAGEI
ncbi:acyltransferase domain-containing protein [Streptomyces sp. NPDC049602]|uniref:acyltransferase domain-containing protein n=1 Tax=Streptomyces sp. NPDC049602 TaxID=3155504 RepID=UPI00343C2506